MILKIPVIDRNLRHWAQSCVGCNKCNISRLSKHKVTHRYFTSYPSKPTTDILFIGEAPGESEYANKEPFIGPAGQQLEKIILSSLSPSTCYVITNSVLCTPFSSEQRSHIRTPSISEIEECSTNLMYLIKIIKPKGLVALGSVGERAIKRLLTHFDLPNVKITHPSKIMQSLKYHYEFDKAVLTLKNFESQILNPME